MVHRTAYTSYYITIQDLLKIILLLKFENVVVTEENQVKNKTVNTIEKAYENIIKTNEEDIIATIEVVQEKFEKLCSFNSEIEELAENGENNEEIYDGCLQSEVNITKKINTIKSLVDKEKGLIKDSDSKPESFNDQILLRLLIVFAE